ncbi:hypothetical protein SK128_023275 [Halocaridina rubra]|uniref:Uncharacterized protein n=1 Tax=Halocaridina rubra TaxID=373956 RepID=A0AAN8XC46_HALRR
MLARLDEYEDLLWKICFDNKASYHISGMTKEHHENIWGSENPCETRKLERNSLKGIVMWRTLIIVYHTNAEDLKDLKERIPQTSSSTDKGMLEQIWSEIEHPLDVLRGRNGAHMKEL